MKRRVTLALAALIVVCVIVTAIPMLQAATATPQDRTNKVLRNLKLEDAIDLGEYTSPIQSVGECHAYTDESGDMTLCFDLETGRLVQLENLAALEEGDREPVFDSEEEKRECALKWAEDTLADARFGELVLTNVGTYSYVFSEYYDGIPTGTSAMVSFMENGELLGVSLFYGDLFERDVFGRYSLRRGDDLIGEDAAVAAAEKALAEFAEAQGYTYTQKPTVELTVYRNQLCYKVTIVTDRTSERARDFYIHVDAYDAANLEIGYTK